MALTKVFGPKGEPNKFRIRTLHNRDPRGCCAESFLPEGYMTTSFRTNVAQKKMVIHQAKAVGNLDADRGCRTQLLGEVRGDIGKLFREWDRLRLAPRDGVRRRAGAADRVRQGSGSGDRQGSLTPAERSCFRNLRHPGRSRLSTGGTSPPARCPPLAPESVLGPSALRIPILMMAECRTDSARARRPGRDSGPSGSLHSSFGFRPSFVIRTWSFVIHWSLGLRNWSFAQRSDPRGIAAASRRRPRRRRAAPIVPPASGRTPGRSASSSCRASCG